MESKRNIDSEYVNNTAHLTERITGIKSVRPLPPKAYREDGAFQNVLTRYNTSKDTTEHYEYVGEGQVPDSDLAEFYEQNGLFATIIDTPAEEAIKHGFKLKNLEDSKLQDYLVECLDELEWDEKAITALTWARLFGGSIIVMLINDGRDLDQPVDWKKIRSIDDIVVYDRSVITPDVTSMYKYDSSDPFKTRGSRLGYPSRFTVNSKYGTFTVHEQRCLIFRNGVLPENSPSGLYQFWGIPEYVRIKRAIKDTEVAHGMAPKMLERSVQAIYKMQGLQQVLETEQGEDTVLKRLDMIDLARGLLNSMVLDADGEDYDFKTFSYTGVSDVINTTCNYLSALTKIPQTILFGRSPAGMNSTGRSDMENYYNYIERIQRRMLRANLRYLLSVICHAGLYTKELKKIPRIDVEFNPLWSLSEQEQVQLELQKAQIASTKAQTASTYVQIQALDPTEVRTKLADEGEFDVETILDDYTDEELEENNPANKADPMGGAGGDPLAAMLGGMAENQPKGTGNGDKSEGEQPEGSGQKEPEMASESVKQDGEDVVKKYRERRALRLTARGVVQPNTGKSPITAPEATKLPEDQNDLIDDVEHEDEETVEEETVVKPRGGVGVLVIQSGKILTGTRIAGDAGGYGLICGPGGHIEDGEEPIQAVYREAFEEFGIVPMDVCSLGEITDDDPTVGTSKVYVARGFAGEPVCDDEEMRTPVWRDLTELYAMEDLMFKPFKDSLGLLLERMYRYDEDAHDMSYTPIEEVVESLKPEDDGNAE